jgi:hypothetical protein
LLIYSSATAEVPARIGGSWTVWRPIFTDIFGDITMHPIQIREVNMSALFNFLPMQ